MRKTALILALAMAVPAWAEDKPADKPAAEPMAQETQKNETPKRAAAKKHSRRMEDARHCLDKPTNTEIIKCAEAYL